MNKEQATAIIIAITKQLGIPPIALMGVGAGLMTLEKGPEYTIEVLRQVADEMKAAYANKPQGRPQLGAPDWCE